MARIRTIKPEFWDSPGTARASLRARLFYIAMWNYADDWGIGDAHPGRLLSFAFPNDETPDVEPRNFRRLAAEVSDCFDVEWYEVDGRPYYAIPSWEDHQRTEKKAKRRNPAPDQGIPSAIDSASENPPHNRGKAWDGKGKGEEGKGNRGTGETSLSSDADATDHTEESFEALWAMWPSKQRGTTKKASASFRTALKAVGGIRNAATILDAAKAHTDVWHSWPAAQHQYVPHLATWLNQERWTLDAPEARTPAGTPAPPERKVKRFVAHAD